MGEGSKLFKKYMGVEMEDLRVFLAPSLTSVNSAKNGGGLHFLKYFFGGRGEDGRSKKCEGWRWVAQKMGGRDELGNFFGRERYIIMLHKM